MKYLLILICSFIIFGCLKTTERKVLIKHKYIVNEGNFLNKTEIPYIIDESDNSYIMKIRKHYEIAEVDDTLVIYENSGIRSYDIIKSE